MTEQQPENTVQGPWEPEQAQVDPVQALALQDEQQAAQEAAFQHLQNRVVMLNMEVRIRDQRIAALEAALAERDREDGDTQAVPHSGDPDA